MTTKRDRRQAAEREKKRAGQPTKFRPEFVALVRKWSESGVKDEEIARRLKVDRGTLHNWQVRHPELYKVRELKQAIARVGQVEQRRRLLSPRRRWCRPPKLALGDRQDRRCIGASHVVTPSWPRKPAIAPSWLLSTEQSGRPPALIRQPQ
jgi:hypothetical protein